MPLIVNVLPLMGMSFLASETAEWTFLSSSIMLGIASLGMGYRKHRALAVLATGVILLTLGHVAEESGGLSYGVPLMVCGGLSMMLAHIINLHLCRACHLCRRDSESHK
jgi:hypothetical protein